MKKSLSTPDEAAHNALPRNRENRNVERFSLDRPERAFQKPFPEFWNTLGQSGTKLGVDVVKHDLMNGGLRFVGGRWKTAKQLWRGCNGRKTSRRKLRHNRAT
jgi:hypothetical protein